MVDGMLSVLLMQWLVLILFGVFLNACCVVGV